MDDMDKTFIDIDDLSKKIEMRIKELEGKSIGKPKNEEYKDSCLGENMETLNDLIKKIDEKIVELENEEMGKSPLFDIDALTAKVNERLASLDEFEEDDLDKTIYDLSEISKMVNSAIAKLDKQREKKRKKAMYCDMARKNNKKCCKKKK